MINNILKNYILKHVIITKGTLNITFKNGSTLKLGNDNSLIANIKINNNKLFYSIFTKGDIGFAEGYIKSYYTTDNITNLLDLLLQNIDLHNSAIANSQTFFHKITLKIINTIRQNSIKQSKKNISYHYDLGNDFYKLWLDKTMTYSSALFKTHNESLEEAQINKYEQIVKTLEEKQGKNLHILEIGCGFGGFAEVALKMGHKITAITISKEQYDYAKDRLKNYINDNLCEILLVDYRTLNKKFDAVVSIEMFEAVGVQYWKSFFEVVKKSLKDKSYAVIQTIYIQDYLFNKYKSTSDFIRHYIFPGGFLPSNINFISNAKINGLHHVSNIDFGLDYQKTLDIWLETFNTQTENIFKLNNKFNQEFIYMWQYYLAFCSVGFKSKRISVAQFLLQNE
jgi:cyclopropane-fatty-acyl-phospholipid synthase